MDDLIKIDIPFFKQQLHALFARYRAMKQNPSNPYMEIVVPFMDLISETLAPIAPYFENLSEWGDVENHPVHKVMKKLPLLIHGNTQFAYVYAAIKEVVDDEMGAVSLQDMIEYMDKMKE